MTTFVTAAARPLAQGSFARVLAGPFGKHIALEAPNEGGTADETKSEAEKEAAEKAAAEAAEKAAKEAAEKKEGEGEEKKLSDAEAKLLKELMTEKTAAKDLKKKVSELEPLAKQLEALGGLDALKTLVEERKNAEKAELERKGEFESVKAMIIEENKAKVDAAEAKTKEIGDQLTSANRIIDDLTIGASFQTSAEIAKLVISPAKARTIYGDFVEREDGAIVVYDKKRGVAGRTKIVGADGEPVSFDIGIKKLIDADPDRDSILKSKMVAGQQSKTTDQKPSPKQDEARGISRILATLEARKKK